MKQNSSYRDLISMICNDPLGDVVGAAVIEGYIAAFRSGDREAIQVASLLWACDMQDEKEADFAVTTLSRILDAAPTYTLVGKEDVRGALKILFDAAPDIFAESPDLERKARLSYALLAAGGMSPSGPS